MPIQLSAEQEIRIQAVLNQGAYHSVAEAMEAAVAAVEQRSEYGFAGTHEDLEALLVEGIASKELGEEEFWESVNAQTDELLAERNLAVRP